MNLLLFLLCLTLTSEASAHQSMPVRPQQNWCGTSEKMYFLKYRAEDIARELDSTDANRRSTNPTSVIEIHDQAICERATRAYYRNQLGPYPADGVSVVRFGDRYGVYGDIHGGEWTLLEIFNLKFDPIGGYWS